MRMQKQDKKKEALEFISQLESKQNSADAPSLHHFLAFLYLAIGDKEKFYEYYEISMNRKAVVALYYYDSPLMKEVMGEERLINLRKEFGLPV